jgi:hypothetical protein
MKEDSFAICTNLLMHAGHHVFKCLRELVAAQIQKYARDYYAEHLGTEVALTETDHYFNPGQIVNSELLSTQRVGIQINMNAYPSGVGVDYLCYVGERYCSGTITYVA